MSKRSRQPSDSDVFPSSSSSTAEDVAEETVQHPGKYTYLDTLTTQQEHIIHCTLPPHEPLGFNAYEDYEIHYHKQHVNRCIECGKNFPTDHFLSLHIAENHDPLTATKRDKGDKTYHCFVEDCDKVCSSWQKRRLHLVDKHMFPKNYDFLVVNHGLDARDSLLMSDTTNRSKKSPLNKKNAKAVSSQNSSTPASSTSSTTPDQTMTDQSEAEGTELSLTKDVAMDDISDSMASLKFVPKSIAFGRGKQRGGFAKS